MTRSRIALASAAVVLAIVALIILNSAGIDVGNIAEWAAAVGTVMAVIVALGLARSERMHDAEREAAREAGMVIAEIAPGDGDPMAMALGAALGKSTVRGQLKNYGPTPMRNVRALVIWSHGQAAVDERGRLINSVAAEYAARHVDPYVLGAEPAWFPFESEAEAGNPPEVQSFTVSWQDRWGTWWATSAGGLPARLELPLKPLPVETFDEATRDIIDSARRDQEA